MLPIFRKSKILQFPKSWIISIYIYQTNKANKSHQSRNQIKKILVASTVFEKIFICLLLCV